MGGICGSGSGSAPGAVGKCRAGKSSSICICHLDIFEAQSNNEGFLENFRNNALAHE